MDQIRLRTQRGSDPRPFVSLSEFVNRSVVPEDESPYSADSEEYLQLALKGPLQAAIDEAGLNDRYLDEVVVPVAHQNFDQALQGGNPKPGGARSAAGPAAELDWLGTSPPPPPPPPSSGGSGTELLELGSVPRKHAWLRRT